MAERLILVCAGGTGGHLFPAQALSEALVRRGFAVELATDERAEHYGGDFPARRTHIIPSATFGSKAPLALAKSLFRLGAGYMKARRLIRATGPAAVIGFGGYPTLPPLMAAVHLGAPTLIHDQNAVMGRANRLLADKVKVIATSFPDVVKGELASKARFTGNPVRPQVIAAAETPYDAPQPGGLFRLAVFGGSQGARVMSDVVPLALAALSQDKRERLIVTQQARTEDLEAVKAAYAEARVTAEVSPFFADLPQRIAASHLIIARSGASTVAELSVIGRPSILVPLPHALDNDQLLNAAALSAAGAATLVRQTDFTPEWVTGELSRLLDDPSSLAVAAQKAREQGHADAADRLAELVAEVAR